MFRTRTNNNFTSGLHNRCHFLLFLLKRRTLTNISEEFKDDIREEVGTGAGGHREDGEGGEGEFFLPGNKKTRKTAVTFESEDA